MDFQIWWLLGIPIVFGLGWFAARMDARALVSESKTLPGGYFKGLNFLLNEQPDKAIDTFIEIVQLDAETAELHFALGSMFGRRGEVDRAIRIHQSLLSRSDLPAAQRLQAQYELGRDFFRAGLLDRSEETFNQLLDTPYRQEARRALLDIYQRLKEWPRAIDEANGLRVQEKGGWQPEVAQFHCELAEMAIKRDKVGLAMAHLTEAAKINPQNIRAYILRGDALYAQGKVSEALDAWQTISDIDISYSALVAQKIMDAYVSMGRSKEGVELLRSYVEKLPSIDFIGVLFQVEGETGGAEAAYTLVRDALRRAPSLLGLEKLLEARMRMSKEDNLSDLTLVKDLVHSYAHNLSRYQCHHCGFKARQFYWQCPGCNRWETYSPRRTEELTMDGE